MDDSNISIVFFIVLIIIAIIGFRRCCCNPEEDLENLTNEHEHDVESDEPLPPPKKRRRIPKWISRRQFQPRAEMANAPLDSSPPTNQNQGSQSEIFTVENFNYIETTRPRSTCPQPQAVVTRDISTNKNNSHRFKYVAHVPHFHFPFKTLVIATDATPRQIGGYLINHFTKRVQFYSASTTEMPWILRNRTRSGNPTEFEMKNLLCALLLWEDIIIKHKNVAIFTDNSAIIGNSLYGLRVRSFIQHLKTCRHVLHVNEECIFVNSNENRDIFEEFIVPADQLSRFNEPGFRSSITAYHPDFSDGQISRLKFNGTRRKILYWVRNKCPTCGFNIPRSGSLKSEMHLQETK